MRNKIGPLRIHGQSHEKLKYMLETRPGEKFHSQKSNFVKSKKWQLRKVAFQKVLQCTAKRKLLLKLGKVYAKFGKPEMTTIDY